MKVHITFDKALLADSQAKESLKIAVMKKSGLRQVNDRRFERYGILSGEIDNPSSISEIRSLPGVATVNADSQKQMISI